MSYLNGTPVDEKMAAINDAIRSKTGKTGKLNLDQMAESIPEVYDKGFKAGEQSGGGGSYYDLFWDEYQVEGNRKLYQYAFSGAGWNENTFRPKYDFTVSYGEYMFYKSTYKADLAQVLEDLGVSLNWSSCSGYNYMFQESAFTRIPKILDRVTANAVGLFNKCSNLVTVDEIELEKDIEAEQHYKSAFASCTALENIRFTGKGKLGATISFQDSPLTAESIVSIVEHLSDNATGQTASFKQSAIDGAAWSTTDYADWETLKATKTNWTFKNESGTVI